MALSSLSNMYNHPSLAMVIVQVNGLTPAILCPYSSSEQAIRRSYTEGNDIINHLGSGLTSPIPSTYKTEQAIRRSYIEVNDIINQIWL